jgi:hypothetical protein
MHAPLRRASYVFDEVARHPAQLLQQMPPCFSMQRAVLGVRYDNFRISGLLTRRFRSTPF